MSPLIPRLLVNHPSAETLLVPNLLVPKKGDQIEHIEDKNIENEGHYTYEVLGLASNIQGGKSGPNGDRKGCRR